MANTTIKITQLPSIGNNLTSGTLIPVVAVNGITPVTDKTTVGNIANFTLTNAGSTLPPALLSIYSQTVTNAAQPNITSVGTLTGLTINNINNFTIPGGDNGQYIQTDGDGNLTWVSGGGTGNGVVGGSNTQIQFNNAGDFGGDTGLTWNSDTGVLSTLKLSVASDATIYGDTALTNLNVSGNLTSNNILTDNYLYANGQPFGGAGAPQGPSGAVQINWQGDFSNQGGTPGDTYSTLQFDSNGMPTLDGTTAYQQRVDYSPYLQVLTPRVESTDFGIVAGPGVTVVGYDDNYNTPRSAYLSVQDQANVTQQWDFGILGNGSNNYSISDRTNSNQWTFGTDGNLTLPDIANPSINYANGDPYGGGAGPVTPTANGTFTTLPDFLEFVGGTDLRTGQTSEGVFFDGDAGDPEISYPVRSNFSINGTTKVTVTVDMVVNDGCSDFGLCIFEEDIQPEWAWNPNPTRIAASYDCTTPYIYTLNDEISATWDIPAPGTYRVRFTYDPSNTPNITLETLDTSNTVLNTISIDGTLNTSINYYIGFAADQDSTNLRTYIQNLNIDIDGGDTYTDSLQLSGGGNANTGNVTFDNINVIGTGNLHLQPDPANTGSYLDIFLTSGPDLHLVASASANLILGKDNQANVMTSWNGNAYIQSWNLNTNTQGGVWSFGGDGNLTAPGNIIIDNGTDGNINSDGNVNVISSGKKWGFGTDGNLTLPNGAIIKDNAGNSLAFGLGAGQITQGTEAVAIGDYAGNDTQGEFAVAVGFSAGAHSQGSVSVAVGQNAGDGGYTNTVYVSGAISPSTTLVVTDTTDIYPGMVITGDGFTSGQTVVSVDIDGVTLEISAPADSTPSGNLDFTGSQSAFAVAVGVNAGKVNQGLSSVAIGSGAGTVNQGNQSVAIGENAGFYQGSTAVAIGQNAGGGGGYQSDDAVAIGHGAGETDQGTQAIAIGLYAGENTQGLNSIAIGARAGITNQANNSIVINATGSNLENTTANAFVVSPIRNDTSNIAEVMFYNTTSKEVTYGNTISVTGNIVASNIFLNGGVINGGVPTVVTDGINSITLGLGAQMDVYGFPFSQTTRGQLTISGCTTTTQANGTWYYQSEYTNAFQLYTDSTYSTLVDSTSWTPYTVQDGVVAITKQVPAANIVIDSNGFLTTFDNTGNLILPTGGEIKTALGTGNVVIEANDGTVRTWTFKSIGTLNLPDFGAVPGSGDGDVGDMCRNGDVLYFKTSTGWKTVGLS